MKRRKKFYSLLGMVILGSGMMWAYLNINLGFNEIRFVERDLKEALTYLQTGNCNELLSLIHPTMRDKWNESCEKIKEEKRLQSFNITGLSKGGDRYFASIDLIDSLKKRNPSHTLQLVNYNGKWVIDEKQ